MFYYEIKVPWNYSWNSKGNELRGFPLVWIQWDLCMELLSKY